MKQILLLTAVVALAAGVAFADERVSNTPIEMTVHMGTAGAHMYFKPDHLVFKRNQPYTLVIINDDLQKHEFVSDGLAERIFTTNVETLGPDGKMVAEVKGQVREIEVNAKDKVEWSFVPVRSGDDMELICEIQGHEQAGMHGSITIK